MQNYRLVAFDLDGTLTNSKKEISERNRSAIHRVIKQGVTMILASGRPLVGVEHLAKKLDFDKLGGYVLAFNGGRILNCLTGEIIYNCTVPVESYEEVYRFVQEHHAHILSYQKDYLISETPEYKYIICEGFVNSTVVKKVDNLLDAIHEPVNKFLISGEPEHMAELEQIAQKQFSGRFSVYRSEPYLLEMMPFGIEKSKGLQILLQKLSVPPSQLMAFGDGFNDLSMIRYAGMGIAMANAQSDIQKEADYVTLSNEEDGVAAALDRFFPEKA